MMTSSSKETFSLIKEPRDQDVLCGRGRPIREHEGNQKYTKMIQDMRREYEDAPNGRKLDVVRKLIDTIRNDQGRFLLKKGDFWVELEADKVIVKTSQAFRDLRAEDSAAVIAKSSHVVKRPFKKFDYSLLKKHAPAGRFASLLNRRRESPLGETAAELFPPSSSASRSDLVDNENDSHDSSRKDVLIADGHRPEGESHHDCDVSDTETENSFPPISIRDKPT